MLSLKDIKKDYVVGDSVVSALKGVSIDFRENEFVSILGPSGCGKTTLLNIIGGLDRYTSGDLNINGKSTKDFKDCDWDSYRNHSIGFVFQSYNLIPHQTVLSNVELALTLSGVSKSERRERAVKALEQVGLGDQLNKKPNQMSGGQMQRVAIARALVNEPDILLADEPTGALDTETSVQIMELLKSISKDKLIIMVTHNPELAMKYSSRIIKLLDGKVIDDSDPLDKNVVEPIKKPEKEPTKADIKAAKKERKKLKTSMSFLTALSLSRNNLMTKKARTLLTSFAGSIGIIGIALILSISNGVQLYIDQVQSDTLSSYPLQITKTTASIGEIMNTMAKNHEESGKHDMDKIYSQNAMGEMINTLMEETKVNNLEKFKKYLDENSDLKGLTSDVQYTYATTLNVFTEGDDGVKQVNPSTLLEDMGYMSSTQTEAMSMSSSMGGMMGMGTDVWSEMIDNEDLISKQYDVIAGRLPEKYNEVVLVVDKNNEINDYVLYSLGLLDPSSLNGIVRRALAGEDISVDSKQHVYTYDELLDLKFKVVPTPDFYEKKDGVWEDMTGDEDYMKKAVANGTEISVVGILRPDEDASSASISGAIGYRHDLMTYLIDKVDKSEIVKEQKDNPDIDVFTGLKFKGDEAQADTDTNAGDSSAAVSDSATESKAEKAEDSSEADNKSAAMAAMGDSSMEIPEGMTEEQYKALMEQSGAADTGELAGMGMDAMGSMDMSAIQSGDMSSLTETQKKYIASLSDEQMDLMKQMLKEQSDTNAEQLANSGKYSTSNYDSNMKKIGYALVEDPDSINIYPVDFASKEKIIDIIDDYNDSVGEEDKIEYTDYVGLMMSSITSIINAISYVLIAFVAISLVVSSIMIGIITYISVLERTKEIGILRSIGASKKDISRVFNAETVIVGFVAGALGMIISYLLTIPINMIISHLTDVPIRATIPVSAAVILIAISICLTLIAGLFPSRVAAKKDPVIALRTE
ncbi:ATP-binding cassette domain-containing protein [uncultured Ruminococcus sp.]|uniref:ABC transporter ATP-binding protein/permease n=1 Tax=uncultured Ruminococcus sp. TaxID=165186 RepID=UPI0026001274|nr:ATP-binding cassette domain-containing protein [uncultured Ruminococcus sp.]